MFTELIMDHTGDTAGIKGAITPLAFNVMEWKKCSRCAKRQTSLNGSFQPNPARLCTC